MAGWLAYWQQEPWGDDWKRHAHMTAALINAIYAVAAAANGATLRDEDHVTADDLLGRTPPEDAASDEPLTELAIARRMAGVV